jgi:HD superfamily phosphohydrolase
MTVLSRSIDPDGVIFTERRRDLIQLGAMLHDLGHMAFSHLFDEFLLARSGDHDDIFSYRAHEDRSVAIMKQINTRIAALTEEEVIFVSNVILGLVPGGDPPFLYEIVNNRHCGVDVDKMDYLRRDAYHTGMTDFRSGFIILHATVSPEGHLAFHEKARTDVANLFAARHSMHLQVYRHPTTRKFDKLYWCMLSQLGGALFQYGSATNDVLIEALIQTSEDPHIQSLLAQVHTRHLNHSCVRCSKYHMDTPITTSGSVDRVPFV